MGYFDVANSPLLYVLVTAGVLYIVGLSAVFLRKSWRRCLELGISKEKLSAVAPQFGGLHHRPLCLHRHRGCSPCPLYWASHGPGIGCRWWAR